MLLLYAAISVYYSLRILKCLEFYQNIFGYYKICIKCIKNELMKLRVFVLIKVFWNTILAAPSTLSFKLSFKVWWPPSCGLFSLPFTGLKIVETTPKFLWTTSKKPFKQFFFKKEGKRIQLAPAATAPIKGVCNQIDKAVK